VERDDIIRMAQKSSGVEFPASMDGVKIGMSIEHLERFATLVVAVEREKVAEWMMAHAYATGHGETTEELLEELGWQIEEKIARKV
jgi:hypothetical protein